MCPGTDDNRQHKDFTRKVDELLAGRAGKSDKSADAGSQADLAFTKKIMEFRPEPSPAFHDNLKQHLLAKMAEQEASRSSSKVLILTHKLFLSFRDRLRHLVPTRPVWSMAAAATAVAVIALVVMWRVGVFTPAARPIMTAQMNGAAVSVEAHLSGLKRSYNTGDPVALQFSFKNVTDETLTLPNLPGISIENADAEVVRLFPAGKETVPLRPGETEILALTWDQCDSAGQPVPPGDYQVVISRVSDTEDSNMVGLDQPLSITIVP